ncbi:LysM peptidoglycan-binding domain-containing protein [Moraxella sp. Tifton1]|uniref:LysM peptidoglycan-binding domain-containing protein n=1 Tax=Moraxella oculi TaxID=2940516 RepID=UPI002012445E|nr:LysM peptidoglycan-binding domain-containing protein [Moraxella sp. Tifton1]MCL1622811.1 LysM peptidoglycan-binding domain-containing protein [Moraxella sp. Tifton1]
MPHSSPTINDTINTKWHSTNTANLKLMKPLALAMSAYFLAACSTTSTTPTLTPTTTNLPNTHTTNTQPTLPATQSFNANAGYAGVLDEAVLDELESLLQATDMSMVEGDALTVQRYGDLWDRIRRGYRMGDTYNARIEAQKSWFYSRQSYLDRLTARASRYLHHTVTEAERRGIPTELALLPIIESSYDPSATSNAAAAGLWQFIPSTGRIYGLNQSVNYDGRRDVIESTRAAYDFLTSLYNQFGSWELALAAYNAGPGRISRAIKANQAAGLPTDYWSLKLPAETMNYVPRFIAVSQIVASPSIYGVRLPPIANHSHFRTVPVNYGVSLQEVSAITGVPFDELRLLNPALTNFVVDVAGPNRIVIPDSLSTSIDKKISAITGHGYASDSIATAPAQTTQYVLPKTGTQTNTSSQRELMQSNTLPTTIAQITPYNTVVQEPAITQEERNFIAAQIQSSTNEAVQPVNPKDGNIQLDAIQTASSVLESRGQTKTLSYSAPSTPKKVNAPNTTVSNHQSDTNTNDAAKPTTSTATPPTQPIQSKPSSPQRTTQRKTAPAERYTVKAGDTLIGIAATNNLSISQLASYNNLTTNAHVQVGQNLWLVPNKIKPKAVQATTPAIKTMTHKVQAGESLNLLARQYEMSVQELAALNDLEPTQGLFIGQSIKVPAKSETANSNKAPVRKENTQRNRNDGASNTNVSNYTVKAGDTLIGIANSLGVGSNDIATLNDFSSNFRLIAGQSIKVPATKTTVSRKLNNQPIKYTVKSGDSLTSVASIHNISIDELAAANNLTRTSTLILGKTITIPAATNSSQPTKEVSKPTSNNSNASSKTESYTIQNGDNLTRLAKKYDMSVSDLAKLNGLAANTQLRQGQSIKVPKLTTTYRVRSGDNLISLARRYGVSVDELAKMNDIDNNASLRIGQTLTVPNQ